MVGCQVFGFQPKGNKIATVGVSQNHFQMLLLVLLEKSTKKMRILLRCNPEASGR